MLRKSSIIATLAALAIGTAAIAQDANAPAPPAPVKRTQIGKTEVPNSDYEVISAVVEIAAGFKTDRHFHPGIVQAQVLEGEFWLKLDGQPEKTYTAGQSLEVPLTAVHDEGALGDKPVKLFAVYVVEKGKRLVTLVR
jgi:quercetin dioxygenase-like cupin family protein